MKFRYRESEISRWVAVRKIGHALNPLSRRAGRRIII
jgi:hypothetical protein